MTDLEARAGKQKSPVTAEENFVAALAGYWQRELCAPLANSRGLPRKGDTSSKPNRQKGAFAEFVRTAAKIIPDQYRRHVSWDHAIKKIILQRQSS
jgi:hypothetical protein